MSAICALALPYLQATSRCRSTDTNTNTMATSRLRNAFKYPTDSDSDDPPEGIDEEEQEKLIRNFRQRDEASRKFYTNVFLALPLVLVVSLLPSLVKRPLTTILSISSLLSTAYILYSIPLRKPNPKSKRPIFPIHGMGPVEKYLTSLNGALCGILGLAGAGKVVLGSGGYAGGWELLVPGVVFATIMFARRQMGSIDVAALERLRYQYRGA
ncbi:hypothetical protein BJ546DRAFT_643415 [Cryomyces antarcticus]